MKSRFPEVSGAMPRFHVVTCLSLPTSMLGSPSEMPEKL